MKAVGDVIHVNVVVTGLSLSLVGAAAITAVSLLHWRRGTAAARRLEAAASSPTFEGIRSALAQVSGRSTLSESPQLRYTSKNASALEVREDDTDGKSAVVVGLGQRKRQPEDPEAFAAQLGHEVSHLELRGTAVEIGARRAVIVHFRVLGWLLLIFLLTLGFIDRRGLGSIARAWGFDPVWDASLYRSMSYHLVLLALSSLVVLVYSYYFAVRREHLHDFRGSQLCGSGVLADRVFAKTALPSARFKALLDFVQLHPTASARRRVIQRHDFVLLSVLLYPFIVAGAQPLSLLLMTGWQDVFGMERQWWNLAITTATGVILYLLLCADIVRLGLDTLLRRTFLLRIVFYAAAAGAATQVPRFILEFVFGLRKGFPLDVIAERIWNGFTSGGGKIAAMVALILLALAYLAAVRVAATGEARAGRQAILFHAVGVVATVGAFSAASLTSAGFIVDLIVLAVLVVMLGMVFLAVRNRCAACGRRRARALLLRTACTCGHEHLPLLRRWSSIPYAEHLSTPGETGPAGRVGVSPVFGHRTPSRHQCRTPVRHASRPLAPRWHTHLTHYTSGVTSRPHFGSRMMRTRVALALGLLLTLSLGTMYYFFRDAGEKTLAFEVAKSLLQVGVVAIAGAVISLLTFEYQRERHDAERAADIQRLADDKQRDLKRVEDEKQREQERQEFLRNRDRELQEADKTKDAVRKAIDYRESLLLSTLAAAMRAYSRTKKARRLLRACARVNRGPDAMILAEPYDKYMDWLNDAQLDLENLARDIETSAPAFSKPIILRDYIRKVDSYLSALIKEYENKRGEFQGEVPSLSLSELPALTGFLAPSAEGDFKPSVVIPYHEVQKGLREDLLHPSLSLTR